MSSAGTNPARGAAAGGSSLQILLVEDSPSDAAMTQAAFREGFVPSTFHVTRDGEEAIAYLRRTTSGEEIRPDLILLDLNLPRKDGREVLAELKVDADLALIPVVIFTTSSAEVDIQRAYRLHANAYITKPLDLSDFLEAVRIIQTFWLSLARLPGDSMMTNRPLTGERQPSQATGVTEVSGRPAIAHDAPGLPPFVRFAGLEPSPRRLLLVEDSPSDAFIVRQLLSDSRGAGCSLTEVALLSQARDHLLAEPIDCVLLDLSLPDAVGLEAVEGLLSVAPATPIVVLSGLQDERVTSAALHEGAQDYLIKGEVDGQLLWRAIRHAMERKAAELELRHQAQHDALTGLANRAVMVERVRQASARSAKPNSYVAVLMLDIDRFKWINDSLGHDAGDRFLVEVAQRLKHAARPSDLVARLGGDEFVVVCDQIPSEFVAAAVGERIQEGLSVPFSIAGEELLVTASVGIALSNDSKAAPEDLLRDADAAMYRAKGLGKARCELFDETMRAAVQDRLRAEADLRRAVAGHEFVVHYQPVVTLSDGRPVGVEALVRWRREDGKITPPCDFIELAEDVGLIGPIGEQVLEAASAQLERWWVDVPAGEPGPKLNVNLSARQLADPSLARRFAKVLATTGADARNICLEVTETALMKNEAVSLERLLELRALGFTLCLDDFGTGYSSLAHLTKFPVDGLKIDRSFVRGLGVNERDTAVVEAVLSLGRTLGLWVVAEGVETKAQMEHLRRLGCPAAQGYLFGRPVPGDDAAAWSAVP